MMNLHKITETILKFLKNTKFKSSKIQYRKKYFIGKILFRNVVFALRSDMIVFKYLQIVCIIFYNHTKKFIAN